MVHALCVSPPPIDSPRPSAPEVQPPGVAATSTTQEELQAVGRNLNIVAWLSSGFGALATVLGVLGILSASSWFIIDRAEAKGVQAAQDEVRLNYVPLERRVTISEKAIDFAVSEQRGMREDLRKVQNGQPLPQLPPLPDLRGDAGP